MARRGEAKMLPRKDPAGQFGAEDRPEGPTGARDECRGGGRWRGEGRH